MTKKQSIKKKPPKADIKLQPGKYTIKRGDLVCELLSLGFTLTKICRNAKFVIKQLEALDMPLPFQHSYDDILKLPKSTTTVHNWRAKHKEFTAKYNKAREIQRHIWMDEAIDLANEPLPADLDPRERQAELTRRNNIIKNYQVWCSKGVASGFAEKVEHSGKVDQGIQVVVQKYDSADTASVTHKSDEHSVSTNVTSDTKH